MVFNFHRSHYSVRKIKEHQKNKEKNKKKKK